MTLRVNTKPRRKNSPRIAEKSAPGFLQWLRGRGCIFAGYGPCEGKIEAVHLDFAGDKGMSSKVSDKYAVPGCSGHHRRQHQMGWPAFLRLVSMTKDDILSASSFLWSKWPGRPAWERKLSDG